MNINAGRSIYSTVQRPWMTKKQEPGDFEDTKGVGTPGAMVMTLNDLRRSLQATFRPIHKVHMVRVWKSAFLFAIIHYK